MAGDLGEGEYQDLKEMVGALFCLVAAEYDQGIDFVERLGRALVAADLHPGRRRWTR